MTRPCPAPVDLSVLPALSGCDEAMLAEFLEDFLTVTAQGVQQMESAAGRGDARALGQIAHRLKSSARQVGALELGRLAEQIELQAEAGAPTALLMETWCREWARVEAFVNRWLGGDETA